MQRLFLVLLVYYLVGFGSASAVVDSSEPVFERCEIADLQQLARREIDCITFQVQLDYEARDEDISAGADKIPLAVFRFQAQRQEGNAPVLMLAGGPGQAASKAYFHADTQFKKLNENHDIYLIDQRGTGLSAPFDCSNMSAIGMDQNDTLDLEGLVNNCLRSFSYDPRHFVTELAIQDFEWVRKTLKIDSWNLFGTSYGTRVALRYAQRYPRSVSSLVLDSPVPPNQVLGPDIAKQSQRALDQVFARCAADSPCRGAFPNLKHDSLRLFERLKHSPQLLEYNDWRTNTTKTFSFQYRHLALVIRLALYQDDTVALLPFMLNQAANRGDYRSWLRMFQVYEKQLQRGIHIGMHNSVACSEDVPFWPESPGELGAHTYLGDEQQVLLKKLCQYWPRKPKLNREQSKITVPALVLVGEFDPITPPRYAEQLEPFLLHATTVIVPGQGHSVSNIGCLPSRIASFIQAPLDEELNLDCVKSIRATPFFVDSLGPSFKAAK